MIYYDTIQTLGAGHISQAELAIDVASPLVSSACRALEADLVIDVDAPQANGAAVLSTLGGMIWTETDQARAGGKFAAQDTWAMLDGALARGAAHPLLTDTPPVEVVSVRSGVSLLSVDVGLTLDSVMLVTLGQPSQVDGQTGADVPSIRTGGLPAVPPEGMRFVPEVVLRSGAVPSLTDGKAFIDAPTVLSSSLPRLAPPVSIDQATTLDGPRAQAGSQAGACVPFDLTTARLIEEIRLVCQATLTELTKIIEPRAALTEGEDLKPPYLLLVADEPQPDDSWAVNDEAQRVPVEFVYVDAEVVTDGADQRQTVRTRLDVLLSAVLYAARDRTTRLGALVTRCEHAQPAYNRVNSYAVEMMDRGEGLCVLVGKIEFIVVESLVCGF